MPSTKRSYDPPSTPPSHGVKEEQVEYQFVLPDIFERPATKAPPPAAA